MCGLLARGSAEFTWLLQYYLPHSCHGKPSGILLCLPVQPGTLHRSSFCAGSQSPFLDRLRAFINSLWVSASTARSVNVQSWNREWKCCAYTEVWLSWREIWGSPHTRFRRTWNDLNATESERARAGCCTEPLVLCPVWFQREHNLTWNWFVLSC